MHRFYHQTQQAFYFSLAFYALSILLLWLKIGFAPILLSIALLVSLVWVILVLMEIMQSVRISNSERLLLLIFVIVTNIVAGLIYFYFLRERVTGIKKIGTK
ncbi:MAG TPA: hypothetical protein H9825_00250 [Candidatus Sphingobacterium stercorigallinarum]|nr:hypothetical protein [Candidatus Sphingobacterium stercorigallinarum]